jgi:hypothetical protein
VGGQLAQPVGAQRHHERHLLGVVDQCSEERLPLVGVPAQRHRLLALVDHQHRSLMRVRCRRQRIRRPGARRHDDNPAAVPLQRRRDPGAHQRGLAGTGRADDRQHSRVGEPAQALGHIGVPAEEPVGVTDVVGHQPQVRAHRTRLRQLLGDQGGVLAQDRLLQGHQVGAGIQAQLFGQHPPRPVQGA